MLLASDQDFDQKPVVWFRLPPCPDACRNQDLPSASRMPRHAFLAPHGSRLPSPRKLALYRTLLVAICFRTFSFVSVKQYETGKMNQVTSIKASSTDTVARRIAHLVEQRNQRRQLRETGGTDRPNWSSDNQPVWRPPSHHRDFMQRLQLVTAITSF